MFYITFLRAFVLILTLLFGAAVLNAQNPPNYPENFSLQVNGQVRYAGTRRPAENVLVRIESSSGGLAAQTITDRNGKFSFTGLAPKLYIVTIHTPGYLDFRQNVNLVTANTDYLNIELAADPNSAGQFDKNNPTPGSKVIDANLPPEAQKEFTKAKALLDKNKQDKFAESLPHLEKAVAIYPKYLDAQILLGLVYMDMQLWEKAEKPLRTALEINPQATTAHFALGEDYRRMKKYEDAEKVLTEGIKLNENSAEGHFNLAKVYWDIASAAGTEQSSRANFEKSWQEVNRALALNPNLAEAHILAGNLLLRARRAEDALNHFEQYLKLEPKGEFAEQASSIVKKIKQAMAEKKK